MSEGTGMIHQEKILDAIQELKAELEKIKTIVEGNSHSEGETICDSLNEINKLTSLIESESHYFFELSNSKHLMMKDHIDYITSLEKQLRELKS